MKLVATGENDGLSDMGVGGNERFRSSGWHRRGQNDDPSGFGDVGRDDLRSVEGIRSEDDTSVLIRGNFSDASGLVQFSLDLPLEKTKVADLFGF